MFFVLWGVFFTDNLSAVVARLFWILVISTLGWVFILATFAFLLFVGFLALCVTAGCELGNDDDEPEFRTASWVAMMFSVGMGIGLMFYGVAEPISHFSAPPHGLAKANTEEAARLAMEYSYFHWALHPWAIYAVVGLSLAYFTFRKGKKNLISSAFYPILGDRVDGPVGKAIDILAIFATLFGTATSLGLGALQINGGLNYLWGCHPEQHRLGDRDNRGHDGAVHPLCGVRGTPWDPVAEQHQHGSGRAARGLPGHRGPDGLHPQHLHRVDRRLLQHPRPDELQDGRFRRRRLAGGLDDLLLGVVDLLDARSSGCL